MHHHFTKITILDVENKKGGYNYIITPLIKSGKYHVVESGLLVCKNISYHDNQNNNT